MDTVLTGIIDWKEKTFYVNGTLMVVDEIGGVEIDVTKILYPEQQIPGVVRLQNELEQRYTKEQIMDIFTLWSTSKSLTINDTADTLNIDKSNAKELLNRGIKYKVLCRGYNSTWKAVSKIVRDRLLKNAEDLLKENRPRRNAEDILHEKMDVWKKEREENEQSGNMSESISEEESEESEEPAQIKVGMKGESKQTGKSMVKSMSELSKLQTPSLIIPPKKKPLKASNSTLKKPHKSTKK